jgi:hypothetical protein
LAAEGEVGLRVDLATLVDASLYAEAGRP